jgi:hypothetical protein
MTRKLLFLLLVPLFGHAQELKVLRLEYPTATLDMHTAETLSKSLAHISKKDDAIFLAYKGALLTIQAKFTKPIKDKKAYLKQGVTLLEHAISKEPENIELRCLRMGVQENSPKVMKYKGHIDEDKKFLIDHYTSVKNQEIKHLIEGYVRQSAQFTAAEKQLF